MKYTDDTPMPFGKHRGQKLEDMPAEYLLWLVNEIQEHGSEADDPRRAALCAYVDDNRECLEKEKSDPRYRA